MKLTADRHEASCDMCATAGLLVSWGCCGNPPITEYRQTASVFRIMLPVPAELPSALELINFRLMTWRSCTKVRINSVFSLYINKSSRNRMHDLQPLAKKNSISTSTSFGSFRRCVATLILSCLWTPRVSPRRNRKFTREESQTTSHPALQAPPRCTKCVQRPVCQSPYYGPLLCGKALSSKVYS